MTVAFVTAAVLALLLLADTGRASRRVPQAGRGKHAGLMERTGHSRAALLKGGAGLVLVGLAVLGPFVARTIG